MELKNIKIRDIIGKTEDGRMSLLLSKKLYEKEAIFSAAYKFTNKCFIYIEPAGDDSVCVYFKAKGAETNEKISTVAYAFCNEVLDQQVRMDIEKRYGNIRDLIVEHAFSPIKNIKDRIKIENKNE